MFAILREYFQVVDIGLKGEIVPVDIVDVFFVYNHYFSPPRDFIAQLLQTQLQGVSPRSTEKDLFCVCSTHVVEHTKSAPFSPQLAACFLRSDHMWTDQALYLHLFSIFFKAQLFTEKTLYFLQFVIDVLERCSACEVKKLFLPRLCLHTLLEVKTCLSIPQSQLYRLDLPHYLSSLFLQRFLPAQHHFPCLLHCPQHIGKPHLEISMRKAGVLAQRLNGLIGFPILEHVCGKRSATLFVGCLKLSDDGFPEPLKVLVQICLPLSCKSLNIINGPNWIIEIVGCECVPEDVVSLIWLLLPQVAEAIDPALTFRVLLIKVLRRTPLCLEVAEPLVRRTGGVEAERIGRGLPDMGEAVLRRVIFAHWKWEWRQRGDKKSEVVYKNQDSTLK